VQATLEQRARTVARETVARLRRQQGLAVRMPSHQRPPFRARQILATYFFNNTGTQQRVFVGLSAGASSSTPPTAADPLPEGERAELVAMGFFCFNHDNLTFTTQGPYIQTRVDFLVNGQGGGAGASVGFGSWFLRARSEGGNGLRIQGAVTPEVFMQAAQIYYPFRFKPDHRAVALHIGAGDVLEANFTPGGVVQWEAGLIVGGWAYLTRSDQGSIYGTLQD